MMSYTITPNTQYNSLEITFDGKPEQAIRDALKALRFRWHSIKKVWYGYADEATTRAAIEGTAADKAADKAAPREKQNSSRAKLPEKINLDGLENNKKTEYGADFAAVLRADLKARGVKGVTIRAGRGGWTDSITATITLTAEDFRSAEEAAARDGWRMFFRQQNNGVTVNGVRYHPGYEGSEAENTGYISCGNSYKDDSPESNFPVLRAFWRDQIAALNSINHYHMEPIDYPELTSAAFERVTAIVKIIQSYNYDNSDSMTDYYDVGFYLDIDVKKPADFTPREFMTDAEREQLEKDLAAEAEAERVRMEEYKRQAEEARLESICRAEQEARDVAEISEAVTVEDLPEGYYIDNLLGGIGKESTLDELKERADRPKSAFITRRVTFSNADALRKFSNMLLYDFDFLAGKGGTGTNDPRVTQKNLGLLNSEQRDGVKFYAVDCVAVYLGDALQFVANPEGYNYARYCYIPTPETREYSPADSAARTAAEESAQLEPFYFPAPVAEQAAALAIGECVTIYQTDGWIMANTAKSGTLAAVEPGKYAQYTGMYLTIQRGRKSEKVFCRDGRETLVFYGEPLPLPDWVKFSEIIPGENATLRHYRSTADELRQIIKYYSEYGRAPALDTVQR